MNSDDLVAITKLNALIEDTSVDYTTSVILRELNNALTTKFERMVTDAHEGYWLHNIVYTTTAASANLRIPSRAIGLSKIEMSFSGDPTYRRLPQVQEGHADLFTGPQSSLGSPQKWVARADKIVLLPTPNDAYFIRLWYYIRPSRLAVAQTAGLISSVNTSTRQIVVNTAPVDTAESGSTTAISSGLMDVIGSGGWRELQLVDGLLSGVAGTTFTFVAGTDLSDVQVGDYLRRAQQTDWPCLPEDFHRCLSDIATVKILIQRDFLGKAGGFAQDVNADMQRFSSLICDRVQEEPLTVRAELPSLRRRW